MQEKILLRFRKNHTSIFTVKNQLIFNPEICLGFRAIFFSKNVPKPAATLPRFLCQTVQHLMQPYSTSFSVPDHTEIKCSRTASKAAVPSSISVQKLMQPYSIKCRPYPPQFLCSNTPPRFLCQHLMLLYSSISVPTVNLSLSYPENRALLSVSSAISCKMCFSHFSPSSSLGNRATSRSLS